jgi:hypothetical protein
MACRVGTLRFNFWDLRTVDAWCRATGWYEWQKIDAKKKQP